MEEIKKSIGKDIIVVKGSNTFDYLTQEFIYDGDCNYELHKPKVINRCICDISSGYKYTKKL